MYIVSLLSSLGVFQVHLGVASSLDQVMPLVEGYERKRAALNRNFERCGNLEMVPCDAEEGKPPISYVIHALRRAYLITDCPAADQLIINLRNPEAPGYTDKE